MIVPKVVSDVMLAFPADVVGLLPAEREIPEEFWRPNDWERFAMHWFMHGLTESAEFYCKDGVDGATAVRHLQAILGSYQPKHEHKIAGVAYLCSLWFDKVLIDGDLRA